MLIYSVQSPPVGSASVASVSSDVIPAGYTAIYSADDLKNINNNRSGKYILMNDIDMSGVAEFQIGSYSSPFIGTFDGNGHVIKNFISSRGLFGTVADGTISNLGMENVQVTRKDRTTQTGGMADSVYNTTISNCYTTGSVASQFGATGGLIGEARRSAIITDCYSTAQVSGLKGIGGLIGVVTDNTKVTHSYSIGKVSGQGDLGGLIGAINGASVSNCYSNSSVSGNNTIGGLIGVLTSTTITNCYSTGNITSESVAGGLFGVACEKATNGISTVQNCYTTSNVQSKYKPWVGIIFGANDTDSLGKLNIENVWADKKDSTLRAFGEIGSNTTINNSDAVTHEKFTSHEFWDSQNLDSDVWDMQNCYPPILKNVGGQLRNWYFKESSNEFRLQVGEGSDPAANALFVNTGIDLGAINIDLSTVNGCLDASRCIKAALDAVAQRTADIGVSQSRLETISNVNTTKIENLTAAYATVTEADVAEETMNFTKSQILASTAASLITQTQAFQANLLLRMINSLG